ncbi:MAG: CBS domain-containing protein [Nitrososphaeraceae archaeon]|nr:CBS domain-containing protein [Nitrososphaeraceae archaeon]
MWLSEGINFKKGVIRIMHDDKTNRITSIMTPAPLETANRSDNIDTIIRTMTVKNKSSVVILNGLKHPEGIITERDIVRRLLFESKDAKLTTASEIMSSPLISLNDDAYIYDAALVMSKYSIRRLPIIRDNVLLGIVTATDLARRLYEENSNDPRLHVISRASSVRDKKFLIWNFMKELFDMYDRAHQKGSPLVFKIKDFKSTKMPILLLGERNVFDTLREYEKARGYISIQNDTVAPTSKGLLKARETPKDWD